MIKYFFPLIICSVLGILGILGAVYAQNTPTLLSTEPPISSVNPSPLPPAAPVEVLPASPSASIPPDPPRQGTSIMQAVVGEPAAASHETFNSTPNALQSYANALSMRLNLNPAWVNEILSHAQNLSEVSYLMRPAAKGNPKNWSVYRSRFIDPVRIRAGVQFWQRNAHTLAKAEQIYGVPPAIIVGIIGVETVYGKNVGNFRVLDALYTLAFNFPQEHPRAQERQTFFRNELERFLVLCATQKMDPLKIRGSYAGAMGWPQFMPSSWEKFAVDFDGDGSVDLFSNQADIIGSVANYFKAYGWKRGMPTHYPVQFDFSHLDKEALLAPDILPSFSVVNFNAKGAYMNDAGQRHDGNLALIELQNGASLPPTYVAGTDNFYVITRYNWSSYYAMSVIDLGNEVLRAIPSSN